MGGEGVGWAGERRLATSCGEEVFDAALGLSRRHRRQGLVKVRVRHRRQGLVKVRVRHRKQGLVRVRVRHRRQGLVRGGLGIAGRAW